MKEDSTNSQGLQRDPEEWKTADEPMTEAQRSYLETLAREAGEPFEDKQLTKAEASKRIDELKKKSPRLTSEEPEEIS
jgi:hypothetical protein